MACMSSWSICCECFFQIVRVDANMVTAGGGGERKGGGPLASGLTNCHEPSYTLVAKLKRTGNAEGTQKISAR